LYGRINKRAVGTDALTYLADGLISLLAAQQFL
jgi:hypothetical protein